MNSNNNRRVKYSFIESQLRGCNVEEDQEVLLRIRQLSNFDWFRPETDYSYQTIIQICAVLIQPWLDEGLDLKEAFYQLGCAGAKGLRETVLGQVSFAAAELLTPLDLIARLLKTFDSQSNYGQRQIEQVTPQHLKVTLNDEPAYPSWLEGALITVLQFGIIKEFVLETVVINRDHKVIDVRW